MLKLTLTRSSVVAKTDVKLLDAFNIQMQTLVKKAVPFAYSDALFTYLSPTFFEKTEVGKYTELTNLLSHNSFVALLKSHEALSYLLLINAVNKLPEFISRLKVHPVWQDFIIPMELEPYHRTVTNWLALVVPEIFSSGMYHYLSPNFLDKSAQDRCDELCRLDRIPDFRQYFEPNHVSYLFLKKAINDLPELRTRLEQTEIGRQCLIPRELELFNERMAIFLGIEVTRAFTDPMFTVLSPEFFDKIAEDKVTELCGVRKNPAFLACLLQDKITADKFLRKSLDDVEELLEKLHENRLGQNFLLSGVAVFQQKMQNLMGVAPPPPFTDALCKHLTPEYFDKTVEQRHAELHGLRKNPAFFNCLFQNKPTANLFLRKSMGDSPEWLNRLEDHRLGQYCLINRHVRKRKPEILTEEQQTAAYNKYRATNRGSCLFPSAAPEGVAQQQVPGQSSTLAR